MMFFGQPFYWDAGDTTARPNCKSAAFKNLLFLTNLPRRYSISNLRTGYLWFFLLPHARRFVVTNGAILW